MNPLTLCGKNQDLSKTLASPGGKNPLMDPPGKKVYNSMFRVEVHLLYLDHLSICQKELN